MRYDTLSMEEDSRRYREFMRTQLFRNVCRTLTRLETEEGGLTPAEVWHEVELIINELRGMEAEDREVMVSQMVTNLRRKLKVIVRDEVTVTRNGEQLDRTLTCILYCLALRLEATTKRQEENPHNDLLNALVEELGHINHPCLPLLYYYILADGERNERRMQTVPEENPLIIHDVWAQQMGVVVYHYADRMWPMVCRERREAFNRFWERALGDSVFSSLLRIRKNIAGDEHRELGVDYNSTFIFNLYGVLYKHGFFQADRVRGWNSLAKGVSGHQDREKGKEVMAKQEYFKCMEIGVSSQFCAMSADQMEHIEELLRRACEKEECV